MSVSIDSGPGRRRRAATTPTKDRTLSGRKPYRLEQGRVVHSVDVPAIKGMLIRGDPQSDIAAFFGTNGGRISEINTGQHYAEVRPLPLHQLPPPGPYMAARSALQARQTLEALRDLINDTLTQIAAWETRR